jgi:hypothetical protein
MVSLDSPPFSPELNQATDDLGAPVFVPEYDPCNPDAKQITAAWPVGILLEHNLLTPFVARAPKGLFPFQ